MEMVIRVVSNKRKAKLDKYVCKFVYPMPINDWESMILNRCENTVRSRKKEDMGKRGENKY